MRISFVTMTAQAYYLILSTIFSCYPAYQEFTLSDKADIFELYIQTILEMNLHKKHVHGTASEGPVAKWSHILWNWVSMHGKRQSIWSN
jgi:hypothetical protein